MCMQKLRIQYCFKSYNYYTLKIVTKNQSFLITKYYLSKRLGPSSFTFDKEKNFYRCHILTTVTSHCFPSSDIILLKDQNSQCTSVQ